MRRTIMVCGIIAGMIISTFMVLSVMQCYQKGSFEGNMLLGYSAMLLSFSLIFVGVKNYRDRYNGGFVSFGRAFLTGLYITLVASTIYVVVWLIDFYLFIPDFMDRYASSVINQLKAEGAGNAELSEKVMEMGTYKEMYKSPLMVVLFTYFEIVPVGLIVSLICALILKKKPDQTAQAL